MVNIFRRYILKAVVGIMTVVAVSCGDDDVLEGTKIPSNAVYDLVTLDSSGASGSVFSYQKNDDSEVIHYYTDKDFSVIKSIEDGDRLILCYNRVDGDIYTSGDIDVHGYVQLSNTEKSAVVSDEAQEAKWECPTMRISAFWRTGHYINVYAYLSMFKGRQPALYVLAIDPATADTPIPQLHLFFRNQDGNDGENPCLIYASFNIKKLWDRPDCQGVEIFYNTKDGEKSQLFMKQN